LGLRRSRRQGGGSGFVASTAAPTAVLARALTSSPIAVDAMVATFRLTLTEEVDKAFGQILERAKKK
jgi:hypothetical protein